MPGGDGAIFANILVFGVVAVVGAGVAIYQYFANRQNERGYGRHGSGQHEKNHRTEPSSSGFGAEEMSNKSTPKSTISEIVCCYCKKDLAGTPMRRLPCQHIFHDRCLAWLETSEKIIQCSECYDLLI